MEKIKEFKKVNDIIKIDCGDYFLNARVVAFECEMYVYALEFTDLNGVEHVMHTDVLNVKDDVVEYSKLTIEP